MSMSISIIAAVAANRVIGHENKLPWYLPEDLLHFKRVTLGHRIIMGRNTYLSLKKPLPGRQNVVISHSLDHVPEDVVVCSSIEEALNLPKWGEFSEVFCIGGAQLYEAVIPMSHKMYLTEIDQSVEGNVYFPEWASEDWVCIEKRPGADCPPGWSYKFTTYEKQKWV